MLERVKKLKERMDVRRWLGVTILVSVSVRVAAAWLLGDEAQVLPGIFDQVSYDALATRVANGHGFTFERTWWPLTRAGEPTAHWSYLYTLYLAVHYYLFGVHPIIPRLVQAIVTGALLPVLTFRLGKRAFGERVGLVSAVWSGVYGYFIYYSAALMTESFYILGILWTFDTAFRIADEGDDRRPGNKLKRWVALGLGIGLTVLLRQAFLLFVPLLFLWLLWTRVGNIRVAGAIRESLPRWGTALAVIAAMILPFTIFNYLRFERFVLLNTNAGFAFFWANHPIYGTDFQPILPSGTYQELIPPEFQHLDEAALDAALLQRGVQFVVDEPGRYVLLSVSRLPAYFIFWPLSTSSLPSNITRVASFGLALPFMLLGMGLWLTGIREVGWAAALRSLPGLLFLFIVVYSLIHLLSWALIRYRLPVDAAALVFAALGLHWLWRRMQGEEQ